MEELKEKDYRILATGEMGIGNTTTSSAVTAVLLGLEPEQVTGKRSGTQLSGLGEEDQRHQTGYCLQPARSGGRRGCPGEGRRV